MQIPTVMRAAPFYHPFGLICFVVGLIAYGLLMEFKYLYLKLSGRITCSDSPDGVVLQWGKVETFLLICWESHLFGQMCFDI